MKPWIGIALLALLEAGPAVAQDAFHPTPTSQDGFHLTSPVDVTIGRDYGFLAHDQKLTDTILVMRPLQLNFTNTSPRSSFTAGYQPEFELFDNNRDLNALNHTGTAGFTFRINER